VSNNTGNLVKKQLQTWLNSSQGVVRFGNEHNVPGWLQFMQCSSARNSASFHSMCYTTLADETA